MSRKFHPRKPRKCNKTGKTMFKRQGDASYAMMRTWAHDSAMNVYEYHTYLCPHCKGWHFGNQKKYETYVKKTGDTVSIVVP
jgi:hypothetical protein